MKNYKHSKIIQEISKKLDINPIVVNIVIVQFFNGIRNALKNNSTINLRKRKHKKRYK